MKTAIITGISGQDGAYLSKLLLNNGYKVVGLVRSNNSKSISNLQYLGVNDKLTLEESNLLDISNIRTLIEKYRPDEIYNLAAQSSVGQSFKQPIGTMHFNIISVLNILEVIRSTKKDTRFYQASSSEMFGKIDNLPISESNTFHPLSPYAISKASAHWATVNYRESYDLFACCGILFNHESYLRSPSFFVKKVVKTALNIKQGKEEFLKVGNIQIKRDFGYSPKYVEAMWKMLQHERADDFIICSGKSVSLKEIVLYVFDKLDLSQDRIVQEESLLRPTEIQDIYGDNSKAKIELGWEYDIDMYHVLDLLIDEEIRSNGNY